MIVCKECKNKIKQEFKGDGKCEKHGRHSVNMKNLKIACPKCAEEKKQCQICEKPLNN